MFLRIAILLGLTSLFGRWAKMRGEKLKKNPYSSKSGIHYKSVAVSEKCQNPKTLNYSNSHPHLSVVAVVRNYEPPKEHVEGPTN